MTGKEGGHIDHASAEATPPHASVANPDALEVAPGTAHERLEGWIPALANEEELRVALEKAFDYRGDITITRKDGSKIEGYLFDRRSAANSERFPGPPVSEELPRKGLRLVLRHRGPCLHRAGHRRRQELGGLDEEVR